MVRLLRHKSDDTRDERHKFQSHNGAIAAGDNFGKLRLCGPLLMRRKDGRWERLIPMPADVVKVGNRYELLRPDPDLPFVTNLPEGLRLLWAQRVSQERGEAIRNDCPPSRHRRASG